MKKIIVNSGDRFGKLIVIKESLTVNKRRRFYCLCDCGNYVTTQLDSLRTNRTKSCGCWNVDINTLVHTSHGKSFSKLYRIWAGMIQRCTNPNNSKYKDYGGRGIRVCDEWMNFESFYEWAVVGYKHPLTIDRINNELGYTPLNCKWSTRKEQCNNRRPRNKVVI
jgi:hypothetical protein